MGRERLAWGIAALIGVGLGFVMLAPEAPPTPGSVPPAPPAQAVSGARGPAPKAAPSTSTPAAQDPAARDPAAPRVHRSIPRPVGGPTAAPRVQDLAGAVDRRGPNATGNIDAAALSAGFDALDADITDCVAQWFAVDPTMGGRVEIGFDIGPDGLTDAWIADRQDLPDGPLTCFGAAIYGVDWSGVTDQPIELTRPYTVSADGPDGAIVQ